MHIARCNFADQRELLRVHALQRAAYAVEAEMIRCWDIPALLESPGDLSRSAEAFWGCFNGADRSSGPPPCLRIIATEPEPGDRGTLRISRLAVDPPHFGRGIGRRLVAHILDRCRSAAPSKAPTAAVVVSTGEANTPARRLYESMGFALARTFATPDGRTPLVEYRWRPPSVR